MNLVKSVALFGYLSNKNSQPPKKSEQNLNGSNGVFEPFKIHIR